MRVLEVRSEEEVRVWREEKGEEQGAPKEDKEALKNIRVTGGREDKRGEGRKKKKTASELKRKNV